MSLRNLPYLFGQGIKGIFKHLGSSLFSLSIMVFTIFLFDAACVLLMNIQNFVREAEEKVGITVFFDEDLDEEAIRLIGKGIGDNKVVERIVFTSAEEAWDNYKKIYFAGNEHLAEGYAEDNPLAHSASYEIFLNDIRRQQDFVNYLEGIKGVRKVNYSNVVAEGLKNASALFKAGTYVVLGILVVVAMSLISNSIAMTIAQRREEIHIMRYIGATNGFIRAPLVIEGIIIGLLGSLIPLLIVWFAYPIMVDYMQRRYIALSNIFAFLSREELFRFIMPVSLALGLGIGLVGSLFSIKRHLKA